jgi:hypothetical protein
MGSRWLPFLCACALFLCYSRKSRMHNPLGSDLTCSSMHHNPSSSARACSTSASNASATKSRGTGIALLTSQSEARVHIDADSESEGRRDPRGMQETGAGELCAFVSAMDAHELWDCIYVEVESSVRLPKGHAYNGKLHTGEIVCVLF